MTERVHDCGALAGIELAYNGLDGSNLHSRVVPQAPSALPVISGSTHPVQARAMTKRDIANLRRWHPLPPRNRRHRAIGRRHPGSHRAFLMHRQEIATRAANTRTDRRRQPSAAMAAS